MNYHGSIFLYFIRKFLKKKKEKKRKRQDWVCCITKFPIRRLENELWRHATIEIVRNFETWVLGQLLYELEHNFFKENNSKHKTNYLTVYWSLFLELREGNFIYTRSWDYVPSRTQFCLSIARVPHSSLLPFHLLGNRAIEKISSLKSISKKEYPYRQQFGQPPLFIKQYNGC